MADFKRCIQGYSKTEQECTDLRDDGYERCDEWGKNCTEWAKECVVSWIPFIGPAICKVFEWVCKASEWICTAAVWIVSMVCHAWKLVHVFICTLWEAAGWIMTIPVLLVKLIFAIPIVGAALKEAFNFITGLGFGVAGAIAEGGLCGSLGICPAKHIRLCVVISRNGRGHVATPADIQPLVDRAVQIFKDQANVHLWADVHDGTNGPYLAKVKCDGGAWLQDMGAKGMTYELSEGRYCVGSAFGSLVGIASPIYAFAVGGIEDKNGCSLWWLSNYLTFEPPHSAGCLGGTHLAHEIGHCCGLAPHSGDAANLMYKDCKNPGRDQMTGFQKAVIRGSKYATYF